MLVTGSRTHTETVQVDISNTELERIALQIICNAFGFPNERVFVGADGQLKYSIMDCKNPETIIVRAASADDIIGIKAIKNIESYFWNKFNDR